MLTDLYLIRHGQPTHHWGSSYNVVPGPDLSDRGQAEAAAAAIFLADKALTQLLVSPFARAAQTAAVLAAQLGLTATLTPALREHGPDERFAQVRERLAELLIALDDAPHCRVALVTHGSPIRAALLELSQDKLDLSQHVYEGGNAAPTCGIWHVEFSDAHTRRFALVFKPS